MQYNEQLSSFCGECMFESLHSNLQNRQTESKEPYFSQPETPSEAVYFRPPAPIGEKRTFQKWDGYEPPCCRKDQSECRYVPVQTQNIKVNSIYAGIECEDDSWMRMACTEAKTSVENGGGPFGAVILQVDDETGQIIRYWRNHNQVTSVNDPTAHAEVMTIRSACRSLGVFNLGQIHRSDSRMEQPGDSSYCLIYSSAEPCPMCYSAICWANLRNLYFAATRFDAAVQGVNFSDEEIYYELSRPYEERKLLVRQCTTGNSLDAFNLWKRSEETHY